jgi:RNA polymerase sigma-70 factor (ECF subfamily)
MLPHPLDGPPVATQEAGGPSAGDFERQVEAALDRGDRDRALTLLMAAHGRSLYRYCRAMVRDPAMAEDAHQTTFLQAYQDLARFGGRSSLKTWLFGIARHRCLDALKAQRRRTTRFAPLEGGPEPAVPPELLDTQVAGREIGEALRRCLEALGPAARDALLLRYQADASYVEMESICGERAATLQARVARALPGLRRCLEQQGVRP